METRAVSWTYRHDEKHAVRVTRRFIVVETCCFIAYDLIARSQAMPLTIYNRIAA